MAIQFPSNPVDGQSFSSGVAVYVYVSANNAWEIQSGAVIGFGYTGSLGYTGSIGYYGSAGYVGSLGYTGSIGYYGSAGGVVTVYSTTTNVTITPTVVNNTQYNITALASAATIAAPTGTTTDGQKLYIRIKDNGSSQTLTWTTSSGGYRVIGLSLPIATVATKTFYIGCIYNATDTYWDVLAITQQA